jgi:hypothetical protein
MNFTSSIDWYTIIIAERPHRLDMVSMVMGNKYMMNARKTDAIITTSLFQASQPHSYVNKQCVCLRGQQIAVTATSTAERNELQHIFLVI